MTFNHEMKKQDVFLWYILEFVICKCVRVIFFLWKWDEKKRILWVAIRTQYSGFETNPFYSVNWREISWNWPMRDTIIFMSKNFQCDNILWKGQYGLTRCDSTRESEFMFNSNIISMTPSLMSQMSFYRMTNSKSGQCQHLIITMKILFGEISCYCTPSFKHPQYYQWSISNNNIL